MYKDIANELLSFIQKSPSCFHAVNTMKDMLLEDGYTELRECEAWTLEKGGKYFTTRNGSSLIAFHIGSSLEDYHFQVTSSHSDSPTFKVKEEAVLKGKGGYLQLNTEGYGGMLCATWMDRPLSLAGRVLVKEGNTFTSRLVSFDRDLLLIPNVAIHMNRDVNNGVKLNAQKETLPVVSYVKEKLEGNIILEEVAKKLNVAPSDILEMDLFLYPTEKSCMVGLNEEFISASRLDDLSMVYSGLHALLNSSSASGVNVLACFDNEEVGSTSKQGANSPFLGTTLERIAVSLGKSREDYFRALAHSFIISADVAHLLHPNYPEKSDPTNKVLPGNGPAIKLSASCSYTTDSDSFGVFAHLCDSNNIPYQVFVNRSDERGGSTIGPVTASHVAIRSVDIGTPMLSMHSARELMASADFIHTTSAMLAFYNL